MKSTQSITGPVYTLRGIASGNVYVHSFDEREYKSVMLSVHYKLSKGLPVNATSLFQLVCLYLAQRLRNAKSENYFDILMDAITDIIIPQYSIWLSAMPLVGRKVIVRIDGELEEVVRCRLLPYEQVEVLPGIGEFGHIEILSKSEPHPFRYFHNYFSADLSPEAGWDGWPVLKQMKIGEMADAATQDVNIQQMLDTFAGK